MAEECREGTRKKVRSNEQKKQLITRLRRAEGQIRGIEKMIEEDAYCPDIFIQVSAVSNALNSFNRELLECHVRGCVVGDIKDGREETVDELMKMIHKLMK